VDKKPNSQPIQVFNSEPPVRPIAPPPRCPHETFDRSAKPRDSDHLPLLPCEQEGSEVVEIANRAIGSLEERKVMTILWTLLIGLLVGIVAKFLMPGRDPGGFIITAVLGIAGAFLAQAIGHAMGWYANNEPAGFLASVGGAVILLAIYRMVVGRRVRA
jgi:uncharacterized membrane protein YeaQ/YmgE (transglycosylase-associated protein family)